MKISHLWTVNVGVAALLIPAPASFLKTTWTSEELIDESRLDPWNASHPRHLMISRFKPVPAALCLKTCRVPYMSRRIGRIEDEIIEAFFEDAGWPQGVLSSLELTVCCKTLPVTVAVAGLEDKVYPKVLFGTGLNTTRLTYSATAQHLASLGYEVIVMDHPYETDVVEFPNGDLVFGGSIVGQRNNSAQLAHGLTIRSEDASFVMDKLGIRKTTFIGQSYGGAAAADVLIRDPRVMGGVNMDGAMYGPAALSGVPKPFLIMGSDGHNSTGQPGPNFEPTWGPFLDAMDHNFSNVWKRELNMKRSSHGSWTDSSLICDVVPGLRHNKALEAFCGLATGKRAMQVMKHCLGQFIEFTLHHAGEGDLSRSNPEFPDMVIIR